MGIIRKSLSIICLLFVSTGQAQYLCPTKDPLAKVAYDIHEMVAKRTPLTFFEAADTDPIKNLKLDYRIKQSAACSKFIDENGHVGPYGDMVLKNITSFRQHVFYFGNGPTDFANNSTKQYAGL